MLFEPSERFSQKPILLPNALIEVKNRQTHITVVNTTNRPYTLSSKTCLGTVSSSSLICTIPSSQCSQSIHHTS
ncbi:unnamed protein product, partial [Rotaria magnacalcarata]